MYGDICMRIEESKRFTEDRLSLESKKLLNEKRIGDFRNIYSLLEIHKETNRRLVWFQP